VPRRSLQRRGAVAPTTYCDGTAVSRDAVLVVRAVRLRGQPLQTATRGRRETAATESVSEGVCRERLRTGTPAACMAPVNRHLRRRRVLRHRVHGPVRGLRRRGPPRHVLTVTGDPQGGRALLRDGSACGGACDAPAGPAARSRRRQDLPERACALRGSEARSALRRPRPLPHEECSSARRVYRRVCAGARSATRPALHQFCRSVCRTHCLDAQLLP